MATWTYSAWREQTTDALRLTMLRQHMTEVSDAIAAANSIGADAYNRSEDRGSLVTYLEMLRKEEERLEARTSGSGTPRLMLTRIKRAR